MSTITSIFEKDFTSLIIDEGRIIAVNNTFESFTGYGKEEVCKMSVSEVLNDLLKLSVDVNGLKLGHQEGAFLLFTKQCKAREIEITIEAGNDSKINVITLTEIPNSRLDEKYIFMEQLFINNFVAIAIYSVPGLILLKANQKYLDFLEYPFNRLENCVGRSISEIFKSWTGSSFESIWETVIKALKPRYIKEKVFMSSDGEITYWDTTITPFIEKGELKYIYDYNIEVTDKVIARKQLTEQSELIRKQKEQLESIIGNMNDGLSIFDNCGKYIMFNTAAKNMFFPSYEYMGKAGDGYYQAEYFDAAGEKISYESIPASRVKRGEKFSGMRMTVQLPDKTLHLDVSGTPIYDNDGKFSLGLICSRDITQRINDEKIIIKQEELEAIIDNMSDGLFTVDENGQIKLLNDSAASFFNEPESQQHKWDGPRHTQYYDTNGEKVFITDFLSKKFLSGENIKSFRITSKGFEGIKHFDVSGSPIFDINGHIKSAVICTRDVTEYVENGKIIREQKENLLQSEIERNQILEKVIIMKDEFLSMISHEFKTPLNVINSAIQAMEVLCKEELSSRAKRFIKSIRQNVFRQIRLVNNLLDITRTQSGQIKIYKKNIDIVFISKAIVESVSLYAQQKHIKLSFESTAKAKIIGMDEEKYERILLNLLSNAIKFTPEEKQITVKLSFPKGYVHIDVKDNGVGIPEDKQKVIFERFGQVNSSLTRQAEGSGIGLSLVKLLVNILGGQISVKSVVGIGSSFIVLLPDTKVQEDSSEKKLQDLSDNRLIQSIAIEFSDIYLS